MTDLLRDDPGDQPDIDYDSPAEMPSNEVEALEQASWHMRMADRLTTEAANLDAVYKAEIERLEIRRAHRTRIYRDRIAWHELPIEALHRALHRADPKRKSIELPYGTTKLRVSKTPTLSFTDKATTLAWAETNHPDILGRTINVTGVKSISTVTVAGVVDKNGEIVPGVEATLPEPSWSVNYDSEAQG